jgi:hypothetical protein
MTRMIRIVKVGNHIIKGRDGKQPMFLVELDGAGGAYIKCIYKTANFNGSDALAHAEEACKKNGVRHVYLQDASVIRCSPNARWQYSLSFKHRLRHGKTWYEKHGYRLDSSTAVKKADVALKRFSDMDAECIYTDISKTMRLPKPLPDETWKMYLLRQECLVYARIMANLYGFEPYHRRSQKISGVHLAKSRQHYEISAIFTTNPARFTWKKTL